jgi:hypothetical protein
MISLKIKNPVNSDVYGILVGFDTQFAEIPGCTHISIFWMPNINLSISDYLDNRYPQSVFLKSLT